MSTVLAALDAGCSSCHGDGQVFTGGSIPRHVDRPHYDLDSVGRIPRSLLSRQIRIEFRTGSVASQIAEVYRDGIHTRSS